jgi:hypothetical protein
MATAGPTTNQPAASIAWALGRFGSPVFAAACAFGAALAAYATFAHRDLWLDEAYTYAFGTASWPEFHTAIRHADGAIAPYYVAIRAWIAIAGASPAALRVPSIIFAAGSAAIFYRIGVRLFNRWIAAAAVGLFVCNALWFTYAGDARVYALALLLTLWSTLAFLDLVEGRRPLIGAAIYAIAVAFAFGAHEAIALVVVIGHAASLPFFVPGSRAIRRDIFFAGILVLVLCGGEAFLLGHLGPTFSSWIPAPTRPELVAVLVSLAGRKFALSFVLGFTALALFNGLRTRKRPIGVVTAWLAGSLIGAYLISVALHSVWLDRYLIGAMPPLMLLVAAGIAIVPNRFVQATMLAVVMALEASADINESRKPTERWTNVAQLLHTRVDTRDVVYFYWPSAEVPYESAVEKEHLPLAAGVTVIPGDVAHSWKMPWSDATRRSTAACASIRSHPHLWLVAYTGPTPSADATAVGAALQRHYATSSMELAGIVTVTSYANARPCRPGESLP